MSLGIDYDHVWGNNKIINHKVWPTWRLMKALFANGGKFLEIGPGNRPRIPINNSYFIDLSERAVENIKNLGGKAQVASADELPFDNNLFDVICCFEILEHVEKDRQAFSEIVRVLKRDGVFIFSVPLGMKYWSVWDELVGHVRRYEPKELQSILQELGLVVKNFMAGRNNIVLLRFFWIGKFCAYLYKRFPQPFISLEHHLVTKLEPKLGAFKGLRWDTGELANVGEEKTSVILMCKQYGI